MSAFQRALHRLIVAAAAAAVCAAGNAAVVASTPAPDCEQPASTACYFSFDADGSGGRLGYYASAAPDATSTGPAPTAALIAIHGHPRDGNKTFDASLLAAQRSHVSGDTLLIAPVFQVPDSLADKCRTSDVPTAQAGDLLWTCASWPAGGQASNGAHPTSFAALDSLVAEVTRRWPSLRVVTIAGFSAGAQMVQHYVGFAAARPAGAALVRYVVADPGTWLYFDPVRPQPTRDGTLVDWSSCSGGTDAFGGCGLQLNEAVGACAATNRWKYGIEALPEALGAGAARARSRYAAADISYIEAELDNGPGRGTAYRVLDRSCGANAQGPARLQRGLGYAFYDRTLLAPATQRQVILVPGCAHDIACVFPSEQARAVLFDKP